MFKKFPSVKSSTFPDLFLTYFSDRSLLATISNRSNYYQFLNWKEIGVIYRFDPKTISINVVILLFIDRFFLIFSINLPIISDFLVNQVFFFYLIFKEQIYITYTN